MATFDLIVMAVFFFLQGTVRELTTEVMFEVDTDNLSLPNIILDAIVQVSLSFFYNMCDNGML